MDLAKLKAPFPPDRVSWRVGSTNKDKTKGMALAYIDARDVMDRLDEVCGIGGWQNTYPHANGKTVCSIGIKVGDEWVWKSNGAGDTDVEAEKGALSDAFKRAAVQWGIGRYLYDLASPWVAIEPFGRSYKIAESEHSKLRNLLEKDRQATSAKPLPQQSEADRLIAMIGKATSAIELGQWLAAPRVGSALAAMTNEDTDRVLAAQEARLAQFERDAA